MNIFKNRPLALGCTVFLAFLYILYYGNILVSVTVLVAGVLLLCALLTFNLKKALCTSGVEAISVYLIPIILALILSSVLSLVIFQSDKNYAKSLIDKDGEYTVIIENEEYESNYRSAYIGEIKELDVRAVIMTYGCELDIGNVINATLDLEEISGEKYGNGAEEKYLEDGILLGAECISFTVEKDTGRTVRTLFKEANLFLLSYVRSITNSDTSAVISAILLGDKSLLEKRDTRDFARLGISHILALSGMHLSIIASMLSGMLTGVGISKRARYIITVLFIGLFIGFTGFSPSVMRAGIMLVLFYTMFFFRQRSDFITCIFLAVTLICIISPYSVFSISLCLSFLAMLGCIVSSYVLSKFRIHRIIKTFIGSLLTTVSVCLFTLPIVFLNFDFISTVSPLTNLIFIPLFTLLLYLSPLLLVFGKVPLIGKLVVWICEALTSLIFYLSRSMSCFKWAVIPFNSKLHPYSVLVVFLSLVLFTVIGRKKAYIPVISLCIGAMLFVTGSIHRSTVMSRSSYVFTEGAHNGDVTYVMSDNTLSVIDCYPTSRSVTDEIYNKAFDMSFCEIESYILTDYSYYSPAALDYITQRMIVRRVYLPEPKNEYEAELHSEICMMLLENGTKVYQLNETVEIGSLRLQMNPEEYLPRSKKKLIAFSVEGETSRYTYIGASVFEGIGSSEFADRYIKSSDVVYFGAYGPGYDIGFDFDLLGVKYYIVCSESREYFKCNTDDVAEVMSGTVFVIK